jgi:hypothetical protein
MHDWKFLWKEPAFEGKVRISYKCQNCGYYRTGEVPPDANLQFTIHHSSEAMTCEELVCRQVHTS